MRMRLYSIYDRVAEEGGPVFCAVNDGVAIRQYRALLQEVVPVDRDAFQLFLVGEYDTKDMKLESEENPVRIVLESGQIGLFTKEEVAKMIGEKQDA